MAGPVCAYRNSLSNGYLYNYYLWQDGKKCEGQESKEVCAVTPVEVLDSEAAVQAFTRGATPPAYQTLPTEEQALKDFLVTANTRGQIHWITPEGEEDIYQIIQAEIDPAVDTHVVFGGNHFVSEKIEFFNELLTKGNDGKQITGITHVVDETFFNGPIQDSVDSYLVNGTNPPNVSSQGGSSVPEGVMSALNAISSIAYANCYNLVASSADLRRKPWMSGLQYAVVRERYATQQFALRQDPETPDLAFWLWGSAHAEKTHLPFYLNVADSSAKVISVILNGGQSAQQLLFDHVLEDLKKEERWSDLPFVLSLDGYREADLVIHLPTEGRVLSVGPASDVPPGTVLVPFI